MPQRRKRVVDPFDVDWVVTDPLGREVTMLKSIEEMRADKHAEPPELLETDEVRMVIEEPTRIDESVSHATRNVYYRHETEMEYPYSRAIVDFGGDQNSGYVISWSRYKAPVSSYGVIWNGEGNDRL